MAKPTAQQCHALTTYFINAQKGLGGKAAVVNRNKARWGFESILMDYSSSEAQELIDYYVSKFDNPSVEWFLFNYEKVDEAMREAAENEQRQQIRRAATQKRLEEWRERWNK